jgi:hypothetical protein
VVKGMNRNKAPSPNGFTMAFFQTCWDMIKDVMRVFMSTMLVASLKKASMLLSLLSFQRNPELLMLTIFDQSA